MTAQNGEGVYGSGVGVVTPLAHKLSQNGPIVKDSTGKPRSGVFYAGNASLVTGKANMSYDVAPFEAAICRARTKGTSYPSNDAVVNVVTTAAPGSNSRIDIIYFQQKEVSEGDASTAALVGVVQGTAASSPSAPTLPDGAIELARAVVPAGITGTTSATITQTAPFTAPLGSPIPFRNAAERDAAGAFLSGTKGVLLDSGVECIYGTGWVATGTVALLDKNGTGYSVPNNAFTQLTDTYLATTKLRGMTTSGGAITVPTDGLYRVTASALFAANGTGSRQVDVTKNSTVAGTNDVLAGNVAGSAIVNGTVYASKVIPLAAGDVLRLFLYQNSGASLALGTGGQTVGTFFHVEFAGMP